MEQQRCQKEKYSSDMPQMDGQLEETLKQTNGSQIEKTLKQIESSEIEAKARLSCSREEALEALAEKISEKYAVLSAIYDSMKWSPVWSHTNQIRQTIKNENSTINVNADGKCLEFMIKYDKKSSPIKVYNSRDYGAMAFKDKLNSISPLLHLLRKYDTLGIKISENKKGKAQVEIKFSVPDSEKKERVGGFLVGTALFSSIFSALPALIVGGSDGTIQHLNDMNGAYAAATWIGSFILSLAGAAACSYLATKDYKFELRDLAKKVENEDLQIEVMKQVSQLPEYLSQAIKLLPHNFKDEVDKLQTEFKKQEDRLEKINGL